MAWAFLANMAWAMVANMAGGEGVWGGRRVVGWVRRRADRALNCG